MGPAARVGLLSAEQVAEELKETEGATKAQRTQSAQTATAIAAKETKQRNELALRITSSEQPEIDGTDLQHYTSAEHMTTVRAHLISRGMADGGDDSGDRSMLEEILKMEQEAGKGKYTSPPTPAKKEKLAESGIANTMAARVRQALPQGWCFSYAPRRWLVAATKCDRDRRAGPPAVTSDEMSLAPGDFVMAEQMEGDLTDTRTPVAERTRPAGGPTTWMDEMQAALALVDGETAQGWPLGRTRRKHPARRGKIPDNEGQRDSINEGFDEDDEGRDCAEEEQDKGSQSNETRDDTQSGTSGTRADMGVTTEPVRCASDASVKDGTCGVGLVLPDQQTAVGVGLHYQALEPVDSYTGELFGALVGMERALTGKDSAPQRPPDIVHVLDSQSVATKWAATTDRATARQRLRSAARPLWNIKHALQRQLDGWGCSYKVEWLRAFHNTFHCELEPARQGDYVRNDKCDKHANTVRATPEPRTNHARWGTPYHHSPKCP